MGLAGLGGAISGGVMGAGAQAVGYMGQAGERRTDRAIDSAYEAMGEHGLFSDEAARARGRANRIMGLPMLRRFPSREKGHLYYLPRWGEGTDGLDYLSTAAEIDRPGAGGYDEVNKLLPGGALNGKEVQGTDAGGETSDSGQGGTLLWSEAGGPDAGGRGTVEDDSAFVARAAAEGKTVGEAGGQHYAYRLTPGEAYTPQTRETLAAFREFGLSPMVVDEFEQNNGRRTIRGKEALTGPDGQTVLLNGGTLSGRERASHEALHSGLRRSIPETRRFYDLAQRVDIFDPNVAEYLAVIEKAYFEETGRRFDSEEGMSKLREEFTAYLSGEINIGLARENFAHAVEDFDALEKAWAEMKAALAANPMAEVDQGTDRAMGLPNRQGSSVLMLPQADSTPAEGDVQAQKTASTGETDYGGVIRFNQREAENLTSPKGIVDGYGMTFRQLVDNVKNIGNTVRFYFGKVSKAFGSRVAAEVGQDITGYNIAIRSDEVAHSLEAHGNAEYEAERGQLAVTPEVLSKLPEVFHSPDEIVLLPQKDYAGRTAFEVRKWVDGYMVAVVGIANGKHSIEVDSVRVTNKKGPPTTVNVTHEAFPDLTSKTSSGQTLSLNSTITPADGEVKKDKGTVLED